MKTIDKTTMRQEASNTFSEGLVKDLNPITTPNNVLTDCINGSFLTFNGDELALQNDMGNTQINSDETGITQDPVKLNDGFYPIGLKEHGGILYIASAKNNWLAPNQLPLTNIPVNTLFLFSVNRDNRIYLQFFRITKVTNLGPTMFNDSELLDEVDITDFTQDAEKIKEIVNSHGIIQFGSYPSPNYESITDVPTNILFDRPSVEKDLLNSGKVFRSGNSVLFEITPNVEPDDFKQELFSYINSSGVLVNRLYTFKLYHKLDKGNLDLTNEVALFYNGEVWVVKDTTDRKFYCPNRYKGGLSAKVIITPIKFNITSKLVEFFYNESVIPNNPKISTLPAYNITSTGFFLQGYNSSTSDVTLLELGFIYSKTADFSVSYKVLSTITLGSYNTTVSNNNVDTPVEPNTTYYAKAFAKNALDNYGYGQVITFNTADINNNVFPTVNIDQGDWISESNLVLVGVIPTVGTYPLIEGGFTIFSDSGLTNPAYEVTSVPINTTTNSFYVEIESQFTPLQSTEIYHAIAYLTFNINGQYTTVNSLDSIRITPYFI